MDGSVILAWVSANLSMPVVGIAYIVLASLGSLVTVVEAAVEKTVSKDDDAWLANVEASVVGKVLLAIVKPFSLVKKA